MIYLAIAASIFLAVSLVVLGRRRPEYSHMRHTISELGEHGCVIEKSVGFGVFLPFGLAMAVIAIVARSNEPIALLAGGLAVGYIGAAFFPIDADAPFSGTTRNALHSLAGAIEYVAAMAAFEFVARDFGFPLTAIKFVIIGFLASLYIPGLRNLRGLLQRIVEAGLLIGLVLLIHRG